METSVGTLSAQAGGASGMFVTESNGVDVNTVTVNVNRISSRPAFSNAVWSIVWIGHVRAGVSGSAGVSKNLFARLGSSAHSDWEIGVGFDPGRAMPFVVSDFHIFSRFPGCTSVSSQE